MTAKLINLNDIPKGGPYSHAVIAKDFVFVSGQTGQITGKTLTFEEQFENAISKISKILDESGSSLDNVVKVSVYLSSKDYFPAMNKLFGKHFPNNAPARTTIVSNFVSDEILVEIDVIAEVQKEK
ncbi:MAG: RidA family protein [Candidatus Micrarchaeaceae archaeon]